MMSRAQPSECPPEVDGVEPALTLDGCGGDALEMGWTLFRRTAPDASGGPGQEFGVLGRETAREAPASVGEAGPAGQDEKPRCAWRGGHGADIAT